jgi:hypothetical protein
MRGALCAVRCPPSEMSRGLLFRVVRVTMFFYNIKAQGRERLRVESWASCENEHSYIGVSGH